MENVKPIKCVEFYEKINQLKKDMKKFNSVISSIFELYDNAITDNDSFCENLIDNAINNFCHNCYNNFKT